MTPRSILALALAGAALAGGCKRGRDPVPPPPAAMTIGPTTAPPPSPLPEPLPEVLATVDGRPIPLRSARIIVEQSFEGRTPGEPERATAYRRAVEQLVSRELLYQEALRRKLAPDAGAVDRLHKALRSEYKTEKAWKDFLLSQGLDERTIVEELRVRNVVETVLKQATETVPDVVSEDEARAYYAANPNIFESAGRPLPFENVRERITSQLVTFKRSEALNTLLTRLRSAATVEKFI